MKMRQWFVIGATAFVLTALGPPGNLQAATPTISGRTGTIVEWYSTINNEKIMPVYQYLMLNGKNLDGDGLNFRGYGRLADDFRNEDNPESRLYYAYLEKNNLSDNLDLRIGRQFLATTAGAAMMDGLLARLRDVGGYRVSVFFGGDVAYYRGYNAKDRIAGAELSKTFSKNLHLAVSGIVKRENSDISHQLLGLDAEYEYLEQLSLYSELQYNYLGNMVSYFLGGAKYHKSSDWSLRTEYLYSLPVFSANSIYSVFAVNKYQEIMGEVRRRLDTGLYTFVRYQHEMYQEVANANVLEAGIEKIRTNRFSGYLSGVIRRDKDGQNLKGIKTHVSMQVDKALRCGVGANIDTFERRLDENVDETTSNRYWIDTSYAFNKKTTLLAKAEQVTSDIWNDYYRGRIRLNYNF